MWNQTFFPKFSAVHPEVAAAIWAVLVSARNTYSLQPEPVIGIAAAPGL